jgi:hypothetical protein
MMARAMGWWEWSGVEVEVVEVVVEVMTPTGIRQIELYLSVQS